MPQVTRTVNDLIVNALYLTGELGVGEIPDGFMLSTGLDLINELLDKFSSDGIYIPYLTKIDFNLEVGKDVYTVSDMIPADIVNNRIIDVPFANYFVPSDGPSQIIYPLTIITKGEYWNQVKQTTLMSRPGYMFLDKQPQKSVLTFYPIPFQPYPVTIQAKCMLNKLTNQDTLDNLPPSCYGFLKYALARKFLAYYPSGNWSPTDEKEYEDYYNIFKSTNESNLNLVPSGILMNSDPYYWQNISSYP